MGQAPPRSGRTVGIDYGTKRVGLAMADPLGMFAQPVGTFDPSAAIDELRKIDLESGVGLIVIGWPLQEDGTEGVATQRVTQYINRLRKAFPEAQVHKQDERYTSEEAKDRMRSHPGKGAAERGRAGRGKSDRVRGKSDRGRVDTAAAGLILQEFLDSGSP